MHANGELVDASLETPFEFELGDGQLDPCLESCVKDAKVGKLQTFLLNASEAFGQVDEEAIQVMNRNEFTEGLDIKINNGVKFKTPTNEAYIGRIDKIDGENVTVDFNHPLAGCNVSFQIEVLEKSEVSQ